ncbi:MAG: hypothetical protein ACT4OU_03570 [Hyphomicrobium sp.]
MKTIPSACVALLATIVTLALAPDAQSRDRGQGHGTVTACSKYGSRCIVAPVRLTSLGPQYRSPGGNWTWCEHDCPDTLRRDTVDFWDDQRERSK